MDARLKTYQNVTDQQTREELIVSHLSYVKHLLGKMVVDLPNFVDRENLEAAGVLGLVEAASRFSAKHGVDFKTFAYHRIRGAVVDELRRNCPLPQQILENWTRIRKVIYAYDSPLSPEFIAKQSGVSVADVEICLAAIRLTSLHATEELDACSESGSEMPDDVVEQSDLHSKMVEAIEQLPQQMRVVVTLYYQDDLTLKQIGDVMGISESRVSRILSQAEIQLRRSVL